MKIIIDLPTLMHEIHANAREKGFHDDSQPLIVYMANMCNNTHGEVTELWDAWRAGKENDPCDKAQKMGELGLMQLTTTEEELADLFIRTCDIAERLNIDLVRAVNAKHAFNKSRPHMHGKKN